MKKNKVITATTVFKNFENFPVFFIDTANIDYIKNVWFNNIKNYFSGSSVHGITTNPSAMSKIGVKTVDQMETVTVALAKLLSEIREDNNGTVYVQIPNSKMNYKSIEKFIDIVNSWDVSEYCNVGIKLPPYTQVLSWMLNRDKTKYKNKCNITGIADCSTALNCLQYNPDWISIIPGRMEERSINAKEQIAFVNNFNISLNKMNKKIITGSMRTLQGLQWAIQYNTVPTIGTTVFDKIIESEENMLQFRNMWNLEKPTFNFEQSPIISQDMISLSKEFFIQMDTLSSELYSDFLQISK